MGRSGDDVFIKCVVEFYGCVGRECVKLVFGWERDVGL